MAGSIEAYETKAGTRYRVRYRKPDRSATDKRGFKTKKEAYIDHMEKTIRRKEQYVTDAEKQLERAKSDLEDYKVKAQAVIDALNE